MHEGRTRAMRPSRSSTRYSACCRPGVRPLVLLSAVVWGCLVAGADPSARFSQPASATGYRIQSGAGAWRELSATLSVERRGALEKLNRADRDHLPRLSELVAPERWFSDELLYSVMPASYPPGGLFSKLLVLYLPGQVFGAYELGTLMRWGPVSSGRRASPTPSGLFSLNWKSVGHISTVDPDWYMRWYFNFGNEAGLALHAYSLPGWPASHGCVRLLERDAEWLFYWGDEWVLDASGTRVLEPGTPMFIVGAYDFDAPPPWRSVEWLAHPVELPPLPLARRDT